MKQRKRVSVSQQKVQKIADRCKGLRADNRGNVSGFFLRLMLWMVCLLVVGIAVLWFVKEGPGSRNGLFHSTKETNESVGEPDSTTAASEETVETVETTQEATTEATTQEPEPVYSEDQQLALQVAQYVIEEHLDTDKPKEDQLFQAYQYVIENTTYLENTPAEKGTKDWDAKCAFATLREGAGECYGFASAFAYLAIALGYDMEDVTVCYGLTKSAKYDWAPHGWCEIKIDGEWYLFDPEIEYKNKTCGKLFQKKYDEVAREYDKQNEE